jgi:NitT/TauT family transport system substrate-binding protein
MGRARGRALINEESKMKILRAVPALAIGIAAALLANDARCADVVRLAEGPFISGGGFFIAQALGYFNKLGLDVQVREFQDGALAVPSFVSGELDMSFMTANAGLFNSVAKGAPIVIILDRGHNRPGRPYTVINVTQALADQGVRSLADFGKLKGKRVGVGALGSINQFNAAKGLLKAGLDPAKDVQWIVNVPQPDLMKMLGQGQVDATDLAYHFGFFAQNNKWGPMIATGDVLAPNGQIATFAARRDFLVKNRDVVVRFAMAYLQGVKEFNAAAENPAKYPRIVDILANATTLKNPDVVRAIAPNWSYSNEDGMPVVDSIMEMQDFWTGPYFHLVEKKVTQEELFDLSIAKEAKARLDREKPFGN